VVCPCPRPWSVTRFPRVFAAVWCLLGGYVFVRQEGVCWSQPPQSSGIPSWPSTPLTLYYHPINHDYVTCGSSPECPVGKGAVFIGQV
jgi:hypothetical protein